jgi:hypothetical protein
MPKDSTRYRTVYKIKEKQRALDSVRSADQDAFQSSINRAAKQDREDRVKKAKASVKRLGPR